MEKIVISTNSAPKPAGPYSQGIKFGDLIFVAGQRPVDPTTEKAGVGIKEQTALCLKNIENILKEANSDLSKVVKTNVYLSNIADFDEMNEVYLKLMPKPFPVRTTIQATLRNILIEIDVIAHI